MIGTPKELSAYRLVGKFDPKDIVLLAIKDPDTVIGTELVQHHIIGPMTEARIFLFTTTHLSYKYLESIRIDESVGLNRHLEIAPNVAHTFVECSSFAEKVTTLKQIFNATNGQIMVFCQVINN